MGGQLNLDVKGHRVSDFAHAIYQSGDLKDVAACPDAGLWILEIQIRHLTLPYGAFYEALQVGQTQGQAMNSKQEVADQYLFSYGTLQLPQVQLATFGRLLDGVADRLPGFSLSMLEITDPHVIATSGKTHHPIIAYTGAASDGVDGMALLLTQQELEQADGYEVADYQRQSVLLASGHQAWVYVAAEQGR